jgi:membrane-bound metal-dependent hydrolase YbcI (DUF457 family)
MIAGHFGFAALVKSRERAVPLWALMLATVWLDIVFVPLFLAGIETIEPAPGTDGGYGAGIIHANYTHSLLGAIVLSAILGAACGVRWGPRSAVVVGLVAFSHWVLDLIVHRGDLPLLPGNLGHLPTLGFGLWRVPVAAASVEMALVVAGAWLYYGAARSDSSRGRGRARLGLHGCSGLRGRYGFPVTRRSVALAVIVTS